MQTNFTPRQYLQIDIAGNFSSKNEKMDWDKRLQWFDENQHQLEALLKQAETPALYYAGVMAWRDVNQGIPSGYPVSLDGCSSGQM